jgi:hypothetical protein
MTETDSAEINRRQENLRYLLNNWDPLGVADLVSDEYECLLAPLWTRLRTGCSRAHVSEFLWFELEDHFGLDPARYDVDPVRESTRRLGCQLGERWLSALMCRRERAPADERTAE